MVIMVLVTGRWLDDKCDLQKVLFNITVERELKGKVVINSRFISWNGGYSVKVVALVPIRSLDDNLVKFAIKARLSILPTNFTLYLWNGENDPRCPFGKSHTESIAHLLNGCFTQFGNFYSRRHNRIVDRLAAFIKLVKPRVPVYVDKMAETIFSEFKTELSEIRNRKVDIVLVDKSERSCYLVEVKVCFDLINPRTKNQSLPRLSYYANITSLRCEAVRDVLWFARMEVCENSLTANTKYNQL